MGREKTYSKCKTCGTKMLKYTDSGALRRFCSDTCKRKVKRKARKNLTGQRFGKLTVIKLAYRDEKSLAHYLCRCDCENEKIVKHNALVSGNTKTCRETKCLVRNDLTGQKFGKLTALHCVGRHGKHNKVCYLCRCVCDKERIVPYGDLAYGNTKSCGSCSDFVNGVPVSSQQRQIAEMVQGILNYKVNRRYIDVVISDRKIGIEYDGWYWHQGKEAQDNQRTIELLDDGWKILVIKSRAHIPTETQLKSSLACLSTERPYQEIVLQDWQGA